MGWCRGLFSRSLSFQRSIFFAALNPAQIQGSSSPSAASRKERGRKREKDRERATKSRDAWEGPDPASWGTVASACETVAQTLVPLLPQHLCSEHPARSRLPLLLPGKFRAFPKHTTGDSIPWEATEQTHPSLPTQRFGEAGVGKVTLSKLRL